MYKPFLVTLFIAIAASGIFAQTTAFNFQGFLKDGGTAANGRYDLQFKLFNQLAGGTQIGATVDRPNLQLINGVFSTVLDFGATAFAGGDRFIEISLRPNASPNAFVILGARQQILSVPFAARSLNSVQADNALTLGGTTASEFARLNAVNNGGLEITGDFTVRGNLRQSNTSNGGTKALIYAKPTPNGDPTVVKCYNGITNSSVPPCGFTVTQVSGLTGVYRVDFGFSIVDRIPSVSAEYGSGCSPLPPACGGTGYNFGANFRRLNATTMEIFTFQSGNSTDTTQAAFTLVLY
jgi:hypothetical protein